MDDQPKLFIATSLLPVPSVLRGHSLVMLIFTAAVIKLIVLSKIKNYHTINKYNYERINRKWNRG